MKITAMALIISGGLLWLQVSPAADFNGDGTNDIGIFRPASGLWAVRDITRVYFGGSADTPMPGDYNGSGAAEIAIFRETSGLWAVRNLTRVYFGGSGDEPLPAGGGGALWGQDGSNLYYTKGNIGIGTSAPVSPLHIKDDYHGGWLVGIHNTGYALNDYGLVVRADSGDPFWVQTGPHTTDDSALRVDQYGNVGIGINDPTYNLHVMGTAYCSTSWQSSDLRWKDNIETLPPPLEKVMRLRGVSFDWKREEFKENRFPEGRQIGLIAQELEEEFPECVDTDGKGYKAISYDRLTAILLEALKAQQQQIESQHKRIKALENSLTRSIH